MPRVIGRVGLLSVLVAVVACATTAEQDWDAQRRQMVLVQLQARGIVNARVLQATGKVPRHRYVPPEVQLLAYTDQALPIGFDQTISQPYIVAFMTEASNPRSTDKVLEIGTGSGYQAAVLAEIVRDVFTIEIVPELAERARRTLDAEGYLNVQVRTGNGWLGWPEEAPFDKILVTAAPDEVPAALAAQLKLGGILIVPVGSIVQELRVMTKTPAGLVTTTSLPVRFVPMVGKPKQ